MSHLRSCWGQLQIWTLDPYLCCTFWGSTPSLAPVPSMSHLRSCRGQLQIWIQLQIHIWLHLFELRLGPLYPWLQSHLYLTLDHVGGQLWIWYPAPNAYLGCTFWPELSLYWYYVKPMLSSKFNILSHYSVPSGQIWIIALQAIVIFSRWSFWVSITLCCLQN